MKNAAETGADGKSWDSTHPCELAIRRLDWTLCLLACLERDGRRESTRMKEGDARRQQGKKMWMPPFIISQKKCNGLVSKHLLLRQWLYASLKTGYVWCCGLNAAQLTLVSGHPRMSELHQSMTLTFLHSWRARWVVSDWAAAKPISDPHSYPIRLSYSTLGSGHRRSSSYWFWQGRGAGVWPRRKLPHVTELHASQRAVLLSWSELDQLDEHDGTAHCLLSGIQRQRGNRSNAPQTGCMNVANASRGPSCVCVTVLWW